MSLARSKYQGVSNIIRFNWPFFLATGLGAVMLLTLLTFTSGALRLCLGLGLVGLLGVTALSLLISHHIYDRSALYSLPWLSSDLIPKGACLINLTAGFDETSALIKARYTHAELRIFDFFDPQKHTEPSIHRARQLYPLDASTGSVPTDQLPVASHSIDLVCGIFSAHEIRNHPERVRFFQELRRILKPSGHIVITEHLRDLPNFIAYTIGAFHFHTTREWLHTFAEAGLVISHQEKHTSFVTTYFLKQA